MFFLHCTPDMRQPISLHTTMHKSIKICIKMIFQWNLFSRLTACFFLFRKANKSHFCFRLISTNGWGKKDTVGAFIKYGNLLNGLWQSHWRSLFRCRWLPACCLPLSLVQLPVREKRRKLPPVPTDWQSITIAVCLYIGLTACLHSHSTPSGSLYFSFTLYKFSINAAKKEQTISLLC